MFFSGGQRAFWRVLSRFSWHLVFWLFQKHAQTAKEASRLLKGFEWQEVEG